MGLGIASGLVLASWASAVVAARPVAFGAGMKVPPAQTLHARPSLHLEHTSIAPGDTHWLAIRFEIDEHWHLYWDGYNDAGLPPKATWTLPEGFKVGPTQWPVPTRQVLAGEILNHIYERELVMLVPLTVPETAKPGEKFSVQADLSWLVCEEACIPEAASATVEVTIGEPGAERVPLASSKSIFERAAKNRPTLVRAEREGLISLLEREHGVRVSIKSEAGEASARQRVVIEAPSSVMEWMPGNGAAPVVDVITQTRSTPGRLEFVIESEHANPDALAGMLRIVPKDLGAVRVLSIRPSSEWPAPNMSWLK